MDGSAAARPEARAQSTPQTEGSIKFAYVIVSCVAVMIRSRISLACFPISTGERFDGSISTAPGGFIGKVRFDRNRLVLIHSSWPDDRPVAAAVHP